MLFRLCGLCAPLILMSFQAAAGTVAVDYTLTNLGSGQFRYDYSITNNGGLGAGVPIQLFDILFDPTLYTGLANVTPAPLANQWSQIFLNAVGTSPILFDNLATSGGIFDGTTTSGFAVQFTYTGTGTPGDQPFQVYDPQTFNLLLGGQATAEATTGAVPEPSTFGILGIVLAYGARRFSRKRA